MDNINSCCYVAKIHEIKAIEGADKIEQAIIGGWNCIVQKAAYKAGDLVIVATTDAIIPQKLAEELNVTNYLRNGNRVRTVKLRGVYSECLIVPIGYLKKGAVEGADCMDTLGVFKYEPPVKQVTLASGRKIRYQSNPNFQVYYKFPNLKNVAGMFTERDHVQITRKIHGTNARYGIVKKTKLSFWDKLKKFFGLADKWIDYEFVVGSHNVEKGSDSQGYYDTNVWYEIAEDLKIKNRLWRFVKELTPDEIGSGFVIYGEIYGPGIQKGYDYGLDEIRFDVFDITVDGKYKNALYTGMVVRGWLKLHYVEILYSGAWSQEIQDKLVFNNFIEGTKVPHEGVVVKHVSGERSKVAKVINPDYLIYGEKHDIGDSH